MAKSKPTILWTDKTTATPIADLQALKALGHQNPHNKEPIAVLPATRFTFGRWMPQSELARAIDKIGNKEMLEGISYIGFMLRLNKYKL